MSSLNLNKVILCGRLTADPELKQTINGVSVVSFTLAINRRRASADQERQADFINVVAWRQTAEFVSRYFRKGFPICVSGSIQTRSWQDSKGANRYATEVVADDAMFVDSKNDAQGQMQPVADQSNAQTFNNPTEANFKSLNAEDLPF